MKNEIDQLEALNDQLHELIRHTLDIKDAVRCGALFLFLIAIQFTLYLTLP